MKEDGAKNLKRLLDQLHSRREFLGLCGKGIGYTALTTLLPACGGGGGGNGAPTASPPPAPPPAPPPPVPPPTAIIPPPTVEYSVLKRTSFGVHRDELAAIENIGVDAYLEDQLNYQRIDDGGLEGDVRNLFPLITQSPATLFAGFPENVADVVQQMVAATQYRQIFSRRQLYEVMVEFWSDHLNIHLLNGLGPNLKPEDDLQVIRQHALGNFGDLLRASAHSPSMLFYLDNYLNQAAAPNENYARELMELHTLGVDGGYTETDVKEVARCLTGWTIRFPGDPTGPVGSFVYQPAIHDNDAKVVLGQTISAGGGQSDGDQVLDILVTHPSTARFIAEKLCRRFISDSPDQACIDAVADAFTRSNGDIRDTLRALFTHEAFRTTVDLKICRPSEYLAGMIRALAPDTPYPSDNGRLFFFAQRIMGQQPFDWPTPDGYPDVQNYWANTGGLLNRWRLSFLSLANFIPQIDVFDIDYPSLLDGADTLASIVDALADNLVMRPLSSEDRTHMLDWLVDEYEIPANDTLPQGTAEQIAPLVAAVLLSSAYFQLR